ncbi:MAG: hypothetical protein K2J26_01700 [Ruminococcus sp.]|nr:hypothetical protein [Ruminococcus sp.]
MERNHIIAWACGIVVFLLIIMAGKSCMQSPEKKSENKNNIGTTHDDQFIADYLGLQDTIPTKPKKYYDEFGRPAPPPESENSEDSENPENTEELSTEEIPASEPATDIFGNPVEVPTEEPTEFTTEYTTDIFGHITEESTEPEPETGYEPETEPVSEQSTFPDISGFNHRKNSDDEKKPEKPTLPPDFSIIIN